MPPNATIKDSQLTIPDVKVNDAGTYVCTASDLRHTVEIPTVLTVTGVVPYFAQAPLSYIVLPTLPDAYLKFEIEISFKPESADGEESENTRNGSKRLALIFSYIVVPF